MVPASSELRPENEATYESLISLIENSQGRLAPIIVGCDDGGVRQRVIARYEQEAREAKIRPYRLVLGQEPSVRSGLAKLKASEPYLQRGGEAVFTVTGAEVLLRVKLRPEDEQSELDKFFGYLQWTREGLREFPYPIVLWVSHRILREMSRRAPDFWSWRKAVLRFADEGSQVVRADWEPPATLAEVNAENESLPPLEELLEEIQNLEQKSSESSGLAILYERLGQVYANRIGQGKAKDLEQEREATITAFKKAIATYTTASEKTSLVKAWTGLGSFLHGQSRYPEATEAYQTAFNIAREIGDRNGEANSLGSLGTAYNSLGQYQRAIEFYQQSLEIKREIGGRNGEAASLNNLGTAYYSLGQYQRAIEFYQQSLEIKRQIGDRNGEAASLNNLGTAYNSLGQYQRAIEFYQQSLEIKREIGDLNSEASSLNNLGNAYSFLSQYQRAIEFHQQSLEISREIGDRNGEAASLNNLGNAYRSLGQYQRAIEFYQQSLEIKHEIGDRNGEAKSLNGLGNAYNFLGQYQRAIEFYQQSLEIKHEIGDRNGEAKSLNGLGNAYSFLGQYQRAIEFYQQSLEISREIGDRNGEAKSLIGMGNAYNFLGQYQQAIEFYQQSLEISREIGNRDGEANALIGLGIVLAKYEPRRWEALQAYEQAKRIFTELQLDHKVEECNTAIYNFNQKIATQERAETPEIPKQSTQAKKRRQFRRAEYLYWFVAGIILVILLGLVFF